MSSTRKRWISAEVVSRLIAQLEREAEARGISRSEAVRRALKSWTSEAMEEDEPAGSFGAGEAYGGAAGA